MRKPFRTVLMATACGLIAVGLLAFGSSCARPSSSAAVGTSAAVAAPLDGLIATAVSTELIIDSSSQLVPTKAAMPTISARDEVEVILNAEPPARQWLAQAKSVSLPFGRLKSISPDYQGKTGFYLRLANGPICYPSGGLIIISNIPTDQPSGALWPAQAGKSSPCVVGIFQATDGSVAGFTGEGAK